MGKILLSDKERINTVYIISKGRPRCTTARTLTRIGYPGEWFIVCGNNDETLDEYKANWGDRVIVFDWYEEIKHTDTLDNFGFEIKASGACPVRNVVARISRERGEERHWQFDDDYNKFAAIKNINGRLRNRRLLGKELERWLLCIAKFGDKAKLPNVGFGPALIESAPENWRKMKQRIFNAHNMINDENIRTEWVSRLNDDLINAINTWKSGKPEFSSHFASMTMETTQAEAGGAF